MQPEHKRQLVAALRLGGRRVGMIGDGVNDVPALKECDVAVALGSGSQLAKGVADVVLVSESFESIPFADRGGSQDPSQRPARRQAVRREIRIRRDCSS